MGKPYWITKEGEKVLISEMDDLHLINTIRMLKRKGMHKTRERYLDELDSIRFLGPPPIGEIASWDYDQALEEVFEEGGIYVTVPAHPAYKHLVAELKKREGEILG